MRDTATLPIAQRLTAADDHLYRRRESNSDSCVRIRFGSIKAKFHYAIWSQTGSKLVADLLQVKQHLNRVSKNVPPLICYNLDVHGSITIIFDTSVTEKVGNQNLLYFITSPNLCFCTTWRNRKPENCVFSLKCCMLFTKNTRNTLKYHLVTDEPPFTVKTIDWIHQTGPRILLSVTHMLYVNQVCHGVGRCVKDGSCSSSSLSESQWTVGPISEISYYLNS